MATPLAVDVGGGVTVLSNSVANVDSSSNGCLKSSSAKKEEEEKRRSPILIFLFFHKAIRKELDGLHRLAMAFATGKQTDIRPLLERYHFEPRATRLGLFGAEAGGKRERTIHVT